jgi:ABC-type branched-subunit amino acid transport system ATPase component
MPATEPIVEVRDLDRRFAQVHAVKGISFDIHPGQVVGFIGANGAGKTTTMRMMATLERPSGGSIRIAGHHVVRDPAAVRQVIGWMPDNYGTYANMNVFEYLDFFARAYGLRSAKRRSRVEEILDFADLTPLADRPINKLSKGMGQRLCFGRMLLPDPQFLILDEPAALTPKPASSSRTSSASSPSKAKPSSSPPTSSPNSAKCATPSSSSTPVESSTTATPNNSAAANKPAPMAYLPPLKSSTSPSSATLLRSSTGSPSAPASNSSTNAATEPASNSKVATMKPSPSC